MRYDMTLLHTSLVCATIPYSINKFSIFYYCPVVSIVSGYDDAIKSRAY